MEIYVLTLNYQEGLAKPLRKASRSVGNFIGLAWNARPEEEAVQEYLYMAICAAEEAQEYIKMSVEWEAMDPGEAEELQSKFRRIIAGLDLVHENPLIWILSM